MVAKRKSAAKAPPARAPFTAEEVREQAKSIRASQPPALVYAKERLDLAEQDARDRIPRGLSDEQRVEQLRAERRKAYAVHMAHATIPDALVQWAARMAMRYGPTFDRVPGHKGLDWLTALMVVRYGEAMETNAADADHPDGELRQFWPLELGEEDLRRALRWESGADVPRFLMFGGFTTGTEG